MYLPTILQDPISFRLIPQIDGKLSDKAARLCGKLKQLQYKQINCLSYKIKEGKLLIIGIDNCKITFQKIDSLNYPFNS